MVSATIAGEPAGEWAVAATQMLAGGAGAAIGTKSGCATVVFVAAGTPEEGAAGGLAAPAPEC